MSFGRISSLDLSILERLQQNARVSNVSLADAVGLSPFACLRRVRVLQEKGLIQGYVTLLDPEAIGLGASVFIQVSLEKKDRQTLTAFEDSIARHSEVVECYLMTGDADYLLRVVVSNVAEFERFLIEHVTDLPGIGSIKSSFALKQVKYTTALPLDHVDLD